MCGRLLKRKNRIGCYNICSFATCYEVSSNICGVGAGVGGAGEIEMLHENCKTAEPCKIGSERLAVN